MKNLLRLFFGWLFAKELTDLHSAIHKAEMATIECDRISQRAQRILGNVDVSVDVHEYSPSWAVVSIQGHGTDYIKFVDLGRADILAIQGYLKQFDRAKIDASPRATQYLKFERDRR